MTNLYRICDGVYRNDGEKGEKEISYLDVTLIRFMDIFYIRCHPDELTPIEVSELCRERVKHPDTFLAVNGVVRQLFRDFIWKLSPTRILEIGAGDRPILSGVEASEQGILYTTADADPDVEGCFFSGMNSRLDFPDSHFELATAVFVLHFHFYDAQIAELHRCLSSTGVFLANVYFRAKESREKLRQAFESKGLNLSVTPDPRGLCRDHEYWLAGKDPVRVDAAQRLLNDLLEVSSSRV
jgi:hypothetical protein